MDYYELICLSHLDYVFEVSFLLMSFVFFILCVYFFREAMKQLEHEGAINEQISDILSHEGIDSKEQGENVENIHRVINRWETWQSSTKLFSGSKGCSLVPYVYLLCCAIIESLKYFLNISRMKLLEKYNFFYLFIAVCSLCIPAMSAFRHGGVITSHV